jgi:hypothetical protein
MAKGEEIYGLSSGWCRAAWVGIDNSVHLNRPREIAASLALLAMTFRGRGWETKRNGAEDEIRTRDLLLGKETF